MDRRQCRRKKVRIETELASGDVICSGTIENISVRGISLETESSNLLGRPTHFTPGTKFVLKFKTPSGEVMSLNCRVIWSFQAGPDGITIKVGMEVVFPPPSYIDFCQSP